MHFRYILLLLILPLLAACSDDEPGGGTTSGGNVPDPEDTRTVSIYKGSSDNVSGIYVDIADKLNSTNGWYFADLGTVAGLGNIIAIPRDGWVTTVAAKKGHGYVAYNASSGFMRLFISNQATDEMGTITGYQFKYLAPFHGADEMPRFAASELNVESEGGTFFIEQTNSTLIPFTFETECPWLRVYRHRYVGEDDKVGFYVEVASTHSIEPCTGTVTITSMFGKALTFTVNRGAMTPWTASTSIKELKRKYTSADMYTASQVEDGTIIRGTVVSSDEAGNLYKTLVIDDGTAAIPVDLNLQRIYTLFPQGQEIALDLSGLYIGNYAGLLSIGAESWYQAEQTATITFLPQEQLKYQIIGDPRPVKPTETPMPIIDQAKYDIADVIYWQSRYVTIPEVEFVDPTCSLAYGDGNRTIRDENNIRLTVRTSPYSTFGSQLTPQGVGSISGILSYYRGEWQLILPSLSDLGPFDPSRTFTDY